MESEASPWLLFGMSALVIVVLAAFSVLATRRLATMPSSRLQNLVELVVSSLNDFVVGIIGPKGEKYTPFVGTLFIYIFAMNLLGLVPGFKSPTSGLSITIGLALVVFVVYNVAGIREVGLWPYLKHLAGEPIWLAWLMLPIHLIGELARPLSLSIRLFGNIFGEETVLMILAGMTYVIIPYVVAIPTQFPIMLFDVFIAFVQALVFSMLTAIYISVAITGREEHA
ncbi:MAG: F0F1 ATP synthase subunit A [Armatimonadetes bacterium]|nr:F0F1 ATP synthase subunit A [Armatimonadota bacterium]